MAVQISGNDITVPRDGTFSRNVSIAGTLTYEDVTNVDSIGIVTARNGIEIGARPGVAASISVDGNMIVSGISTFGGDVQVPDKIIHAGDTNTAIRFPDADTVSVETSGAEKARIDSSGRLIIGHSGSSGKNSPLQVVGTGDNAEFQRYENNEYGPNIHFIKSRNATTGSNTVVNSGDALGTVNFRGADGTNYITAAEISAEVDNTPGTNDMPGRLVFKTTSDGASSATEKLRIDNGGKLLLSGSSANIKWSSADAYLYSYKGGSDGQVRSGIEFSGTNQYMRFFCGTNERLRLNTDGTFTNTASASAPTSGSGWGFTQDQLYLSTAGSSANYALRFYNDNGLVGSVLVNGSGVTYNTSSDYRLKENQVSISDAISKVKQLKPYTFNFKADSSTKIDGFFAHEAQEVVPHAVSGEKDGEQMQSMDYGKLTPLLTAALQEAISEIETLKTEVAALKSQLNN